MQSLKKLVHTLQSNKITLTFIALFFMILSFNLKLLLIPVILLIIKYNKRINLKLLIILVVVFGLLYLLINNLNITSYIEGNYYITNKKSYETINLYTIKKGIKSFNVYLKDDLLVGQYIKIKGSITKFDDLRIPKGFNKYQYYLSRGILGQVDIISYEVSKLSNPLYKFSSVNIFNDNNYLNLFFGNGMDLLLEEESLKYLNILHYFSLSGLHIYLIFKIVSLLTYNFNFSSNSYNIVKIVIVTIFYFISTFSLSVFRILIYEILKYYNNKYNMKINNYTLLNVTFILLILINPFNIINTNLIIMYLIVCGITLLRPLYSNDNTLVKSIKISLITSLIMLPFSLKVNVIGVLFAPMFIVVICYLIFPLAIISIFSYNLTPLLDYIINLLNKIIELFSNQSILINFPMLNGYLVILYFILLISLLYLNKKYYIVIISFIVLVLFSPIIFNKFKAPSLVFLDVGQGDSAVYTSSSVNVVIDTFDGTVDYLLNEGVVVVDYLILTHSDIDHIKEANLLISMINVKNIIVNPYDNYNLIYHKNTKLIKIYKDFKYTKDDLTMSFYSSDINYNNSNNNSLVFKLSFDSNDILFTGDIELEREEELVSKYKDKLNSNYLKVAHHGSNTSSSQNFINCVNPSYAIISVSKKNRYQLPSEEVVNRFKYKGIVVYQTKDCKTIKLMNRKLVFM